MPEKQTQPEQKKDTDSSKIKVITLDSLRSQLNEKNELLTKIEKNKYQVIGQIQLIMEQIKALQE